MLWRGGVTEHRARREEHRGGSVGGGGRRGAGQTTGGLWVVVKAPGGGGGLVEVGCRVHVKRLQRLEWGMVCLRSSALAAGMATCGVVCFFPS